MGLSTFNSVGMSTGPWVDVVSAVRNVVVDVPVVVKVPIGPPAICNDGSSIIHPLLNDSSECIFVSYVLRTQGKEA